MRGLKWTIAAAACAALLWPATAAADEPPYLDPFSLLPGVETQFRPTTSDECPDGAPACLERTLRRMRRRFHRVIPPCDHNAVFSLTYLRLTEDLDEQLRGGLFEEPAWVQHEDAIFGRQYFEAYDRWAAGDRDRVPEAWLLAFDSARARQVYASGNLLMGINAHVNRDLPYLIAAAGMVRPDGRNRKRDHDAVNRRLLTLYHPILEEMAGRFDPLIDDHDLPGALDDPALLEVLYAWREFAWRNAERLVAARTPAERQSVAQSIEDYAAGTARTLKAAYGYQDGDPEAANNRDLFCATHGGQDRSYGSIGGLASVSIHRNRLRRARDRTVPVRIDCPDDVSACKGSLTLQALRKGRKPLRLGRKSFALEPDQGLKLRVPIGSHARAWLGGEGTVFARVDLRRWGVAGKRALTRRAARLR